jgi:alkyl sulfatase BDS1-like metallo-beta-lactamase superfamily hydrolase
MNQKLPTESIESAHRTLRETLPMSDTTDFDDADRGFMASLEPGEVRAADWQVVWESDTYAFLNGDAPASVNPSLWRQSILAAKQGLYEVVEGIYQVRGLDLSNLTVVEGDTGVILIDPLISTETAAAALALYRKHRGRQAGRGGDLHPQPRGPLRRRLRGGVAKRRRLRTDPGDCPGRIH